MPLAGSERRSPTALEICGQDVVASDEYKVMQRPHVADRNHFQRPDTGLKAPPALGGSAMVVRLTGRQIFAANGTAPACHDRRAEPGHSTSEMIQEDMKIL
jgi:hypothetical protein